MTNTSERHHREYNTAGVVTMFAQQGVSVASIARAMTVPASHVEQVCRRAIESGDLLRMPPNSADNVRDAMTTELVHLRDRVDELRSELHELRGDAPNSSDVLGFRGAFGLTGKEAAIVGALVQHPGGRTKARLYTSVYGLGEDTPDPKIIDVFICKIRKKLPPGCTIDTVWGWGYRMTRESVALLQGLPVPEPTQESPSLAPELNDLIGIHTSFDDGRVDTLKNHLDHMEKKW